MPWAVAGTTDASANIPIAPMIQIHARIIVSLYLIVCRPERLLHRTHYPLGRYTINGFTTVPEQEAALEGLD
jgi:hypothetical protein